MKEPVSKTYYFVTQPKNVVVKVTTDAGFKAARSKAMAESKRWCSFWKAERA